VDYRTLSEDLKRLISPLLEAEDVELVELNFIRAPSSSVVRLLVDKKTWGINLEECASLNQKIRAFLDTQDIIRDGYILEVSSPGLDRPLKTKNDFLRCRDKIVRVFLRQPINGIFEVEGNISKVTDDSVYIAVASETIEIPLSAVSKAKQIF